MTVFDWGSVLRSLCSWWKHVSYLDVLEKETEVRTSEYYPHCACFWPWPQPGLCFEPECSYTPHDPHHPSFPTIWVSNCTDMAYCHGAEQMFTHGPRILALLALTYKLSLLLWRSSSGNECLSTCCFQSSWTIDSTVSALKQLFQSEMAEWHKEERTKDIKNEKKNSM